MNDALIPGPEAPDRKSTPGPESTAIGGGEACSAAALRTPLTTYRIQLHGGFGFRQAAGVVPYLSDLGVTDLYVSPILEARPGSLHGYDVTNHAALHPEIGTEAELQALSQELHARGMGLILDIVPNHMGIGGGSNRWWQDVLENGPSSAFARCFDIDWSPRQGEKRGKVLVPCLGEPYGPVLERGEIRLARQGDRLLIRYWEHRFPVSPRSWPRILRPALEKARPDGGPDAPGLVELAGIIEAGDRLAVSDPAADPEAARALQQELHTRFAHLLEHAGDIRTAIDRAVEEINGRPGEPAGLDALHELLEEQHYRLCHWRMASEEINYRRFFDINELVGVRVEDPEVFQAVHSTVLRLIREGIVTGLRIDHPDGLHDPAGYFHRLQAACRDATSGMHQREEPHGQHAYIVVEKILSGPERLRSEWPVAGTTGYEYLNLLGGLFIDPRGEEPLHLLYDRFTDTEWDVADVLYRSKKQILETSFQAEVKALQRRLESLAAGQRSTRDLSRRGLEAALLEVLACFPVYRTYLTASMDAVPPEDREIIEEALRGSARRRPDLDPSLFRFIGSLLLLEGPRDAAPGVADARRDFVLRLQQTTGPVMAKGLEDTAFYRVFPLASLNEVGGELEKFGGSPEEFHAKNAERLESLPHTMNCTATHDTKRGEDVRTRISVLSEIPGQWERTVTRWSRLNRKIRLTVHGREVPEPNTEYLIYQTLVGAWPADLRGREIPEDFIRRMEEYLQKALKEAKVHTSWTDPDTGYENAVREFIRRILAPGRENRFLTAFRRFHSRVAFVGMLHSLSQVLLKATSPGVPDFFQGTELWSLVLVDPDNRRPVDFDPHRRMLDRIRRREARVGPRKLLRELAGRWRDGRLKLYLTWKVLGLRRAHADLFLDGAYLPLEATGSGATRLCAFSRAREGEWTLTAAGRLLAGFLPETRFPLDPSVWNDTTLELPAGAPSLWRNVLTGEEHSASGPADSRHLSVAGLFTGLPLALLEGVPGA